ncbi:hypothetical protein [Actinophytocola sp. KF-1]
MSDNANSAEVTDACRKWPGLTMLLQLPGPPWRVMTRSDGEVCCQRVYEYFVETVHIADPLHVGANRRPIEGRTRPALAPETFSGTLRGAIAFLIQPPHWEGEPRPPT